MKTMHHVVIEVILSAIIVALIAGNRTVSPEVGESDNVKIDSLNNLIDIQISINDSIMKSFEMKKDTIKLIKLKYVKKIDVVINNTPDDDYMFFTDYLRDKFDTTEAGEPYLLRQ